MMSNYGQYNNYYDPVGSQPHQPTGYAYKANGSSTWPNSAPDYGSMQPSFSNNGYNAQQYPVSQPANRVGYNATTNGTVPDGASPSISSSARSAQTQNNNGNLYRHNPHTANYSSQQISQPRHFHSTPSPLYSNRPSSSAEVSTVEHNYESRGHQHSVSSSGGYQQTIPNTDGEPQSRPHVTPNYHQQHTVHQPHPQVQPHRFQSPLNAIQAPAHGHPISEVRGINRHASPNVANDARSAQQASNQYRGPSAEPSHATVNPSQVYDNRAELQRQAQLEAERIQRREAEIQEAKAKEERIAAEQQRALQEKQRMEEQQKAEDQRREDQENVAAEEARKKKEQQAKRNERRAKAREEQRQSKTAATALQSLATGGAERLVSNGAPSASDSVDDEEEQMRAMFQKMREFNAKNPTMLAKMWEEERKTHAQSQQPMTAITAPFRAPPSVITTTSSALQETQTIPVSTQKFKSPTPDPKMNEQPPPHSRQNSSGPPGLGYWPNQTRGILAEAAARWLLAIPQNAGKEIAGRFILEMFNANPSYVQLCQIFESKGWKFDRSALARVLLKAAPDTGKSVSSNSPLENTHSAVARPDSDFHGLSNVAHGSSVRSSNNGNTGQTLTPEPSTTTTVNYETPLALADVARAVNAVSSHITTEMEQMSMSQVHQKVKQELPQAPPRPPADKEEAARKRTFGDLVDLTAENSDEEEPPPKKFMREAAVPMTHIPERLQDQNGPPQLTGLWKPLAFSNFMRRAPGHFGPGFDPMRAPATVPSNEDRPPAPPPALPKSKPSGPSQEQLQHSRLRGRMLVEPIMRDRVARKSHYDSRSIARDVLLATGRHPDMRPLNGHLTSMQKLLGNHGGQVDHESRTHLKCDLATIRWDIIDPDGPTSLDLPHDESQNLAVSRTVGDTSSSTHNRAPRYTTPAHLNKQTPQSPMTNGLGKPASRQTNADSQRVNSSTTTSQGGPNMSQRVGYAAFRSGDPDAPKKKGRPFGWRKAIHSREAAGLPSAGHSLPSRARDSQLPADGAHVEPSYQVYKCRVVQCGAQLHNLETLKKHVVKIHGRPTDNGKYPCRWRKCAAGEFEDIDAWMKHTDTRHLQSIAWKLGDGPRGGSLKDSLPDSDSYLSDSRGRSVTPIISVASPKDILNSASANEHANTIQWPKRVGRPSTNSDERSAIEELKDLERHKHAVGTVLDRQGCVLASQERRRTFLEDEDFEDEVEGSEHESVKDLT